MFLKTTKFDYFLLWGNSHKNENMIILEIEKNFIIDRIVRIKPFFFFFKLISLYKFSFIPIHFLIIKSFYLRKFKKEMLFIFIKNTNPQYTHHWNGVFRNLYCNKVFDFKKRIRKQYQLGNIEEHIIHSGDNLLDYYKALQISKDKKQIYDLKKMKTIQSIDLNNIYALTFIGTRWNFTVNKTKLIDTPHFKFISNNDNSRDYLKYIEKFRGTGLKENYSLIKFQKMLNSFKSNNFPDELNYIILKKIKNNFVIIDGLHRACISSYLNINNLRVYLYE
jgi:hypothetical protein